MSALCMLYETNVYPSEYTLFFQYLTAAKLFVSCVLRTRRFRYFSMFKIKRKTKNGPINFCSGVNRKNNSRYSKKFLHFVTSVKVTIKVCYIIYIMKKDLKLFHLFLQSFRKQTVVYLLNSDTLSGFIILKNITFFIFSIKIRMKFHFIIFTFFFNFLV